MKNDPLVQLSLTLKQAILFQYCFYLCQGHLSPDAAFIYNVEQDATYYFINVAPQFQSFNNGNWKSLEINTRDLAMK